MASDAWLMDRDVGTVAKLNVAVLTTLMLNGGGRTDQCRASLPPTTNVHVDVPVVAPAVNVNCFGVATPGANVSVDGVATPPIVHVMVTVHPARNGKLAPRRHRHGRSGGGASHRRLIAGQNEILRSDDRDGGERGRRVVRHLGRTTQQVRARVAGGRARRRSDVGPAECAAGADGPREHLGLRYQRATDGQRDRAEERSLGRRHLNHAARLGLSQRGWDAIAVAEHGHERERRGRHHGDQSRRGNGVVRGVVTGASRHRERERALRGTGSVARRVHPRLGRDAAGREEQRGREGPPPAVHAMSTVTPVRNGACAGASDSVSVGLALGHLRGPAAEREAGLRHNDDGGVGRLDPVRGVVAAERVAARHGLRAGRRSEAEVLSGGGRDEGERRAGHHAGRARHVHQHRREERIDVRRHGDVAGDRLVRRPETWAPATEAGRPSVVSSLKVPLHTHVERAGATRRSSPPRGCQLQSE